MSRLYLYVIVEHFLYKQRRTGVLSSFWGDNEVRKIKKKKDV